MPRYDSYHNAVRQALIKDGWSITDDPFILDYQGVRLYADLGAEKPLAAEKEGQQIVVEIKVFGGPSFVTELERAVGQYGIYRLFLRRISPKHELFLAVPDGVYHDFFQKPAFQEVVIEYKIQLIVFSPSLEEIVQWIK